MANLTPAAPPVERVLQVPAFDLKDQFAALKPELMAAVERVLDAQACVNGPDIAELETRIADYCQANHGVGVTSGTDAILVILQALELQCGTRVITSPFTFFATAGSPWRLGIDPVFVDIHPDTLNMDAGLIEGALASTDRETVKAIMPVHLFGQCCDMDAVGAAAQKHGLHIIEDMAQAIGATWNGKPAGSFGDAAAVSFYPTKNLGGAGDGGMALFKDPEVAARAKLIRNHGAKERYFHDEVGGNFRLDTLQAAYLLVKLDHLDAWHAQRREHAAFYDDAFAEVDAVTTPSVKPQAQSVVNQYTIRLPDESARDGVKAYLQEAGVGSAVYYPVPLHLQQCFAKLGHKPGDFPHSEAAAQTVLSLPIFPELKPEQRDHVAQTIRRYFGG